MDATASSRLTASEYLAQERASETKHEYVNGEVWAMAGGSPRHAAICASLAQSVGGRLGDDCGALSSDARIHCPVTGLYTYPDLVVVCGQVETHSEDPNSITNPRAIFEVLSKSTEAYDRGAKFEHYRQIESLKAYVLVSQSQPLVHQLLRRDDGDWVLLPTVGLEATLALSPFGIDVPMSEVYRRYLSYPGDDVGRG